jgi:hypothetical protein
MGEPNALPSIVPRGPHDAAGHQNDNEPFAKVSSSIGTWWRSRSGKAERREGI